MAKPKTPVPQANQSDRRSRVVPRLCLSAAKITTAIADMLQRQFEERLSHLEDVEVVICGKPLTKKEAAEISEHIRRSREEMAKARQSREQLETASLALPESQRTELVYRLIDSLAANEPRLPEPVADKPLRHQAPQPVTRRRAAQSPPAQRKGTTKKSATATAR